MEQSRIDSLLAQVKDALESGKVDDAIRALTALHPADQAEAFADLEELEQRELITQLDSETTAGLLEEMHEEQAAQIVSDLPPETLADVLDEMDPEDAADILGDLPAEQAQSALAHMEEAAEVKPLLKYRPDTAGGIMSPDFIAFDAGKSALQCIESLRVSHPSSEIPYYIYVTNHDGLLQGVIGLRDLIVARPETPIELIMTRQVLSVSVDADQEEAARLMTKYGFLLLPVVDAKKRLVGVIHNEDIVDVLKEEASEDIYRLTGVSTDGQLQVWSPVGVNIKRRLPWLYFNLITAFLAASVVSFFEATISKLAVLAVFQGIIAGLGGIAGTQTLALMVRGIALGEVQFKDSKAALFKEIQVGLLHGVLIGISVGFFAYLWKGNALLGVIITLGLIGNMVAAALAGTLVPLTLKAVGTDPALGSGVVTGITDCVGFGLFLGIATLLLPYLA